MTDIINDLMQNCYAELQRKKDVLIKQKLVEKGFGHLCNGLDKKRFPKVCAVKQDDWTFYYADNDTDEGFFIVAIEDYKVSPTPADEHNYNVNVNFNWQDKHPLIYHRKNIYDWVYENALK